MHSFSEILSEIRKDSELCIAVEVGGIICYNKKQKRSKYCGKHQTRMSRFKSVNLPIKIKKNCKMIPCDGKVIALGYCNKHYRKHKLVTESNKCIADKCNNCAYLKQYCNKHYIRLKRYGDINANFSHLRYRNIKEGHIPHNKGKYNTKKCLAPDCEIINGHPYRFTKGLCKKHHSRWKKYGDFNITSKKQFLEKQNITNINN
jgi:hypothetical protein